DAARCDLSDDGGSERGDRAGDQTLGPGSRRERQEDVRHLHGDGAVSERRMSRKLSRPSPTPPRPMPGGPPEPDEVETTNVRATNPHAVGPDKTHRLRGTKTK